MLSCLPLDLPPPDQPPPSTPQISINHSLQLCMIMDSKCISKLNQLQPPSASLNDSILPTKCLPKVTRPRPTSASLSSPDHGLPGPSPNSLDHVLQVHFQTFSITAYKCISELLALGLQMNLQTRSIMASKCISAFNLSLASK
jgi:hypothetical protein